ncbi:MAG: hypothetical protein H7329_11205 [Opitutaceae bacterium]|nr:hypothetical protein [Cytophagales bacterium]
MQIFKKTVVVVATILLNQIISNAQNWVLPSGAVTDAAPNNLIGIQGAGDKPLRISADNGSQIQFFTGVTPLKRMEIDQRGTLSIGSNVGTGFTSQNLFISTLGGGTGYQGGWTKNAAITINTQLPNTQLSIGCGGGVGSFYIGNRSGRTDGSEPIMHLSLETNTSVRGFLSADKTLSVGGPNSAPFKDYKFAVNGKSNLVGNVSIGVIDTLAPSQLLNIASIGGDQFIQFVRKPDGTQSSFSGKSGIILSNGAKITQSSFPNYGSGSLDIENGTAKIALFEGTVNFGGLIGAGNTAGKFNFNDLAWTNSLVVSDYGTPAPGSFKQIPTGFKFAVNGKSNFLDNVVIGNTADFTKGFDKKGYKLLVSEGIMSEKFKCAIKTTDNWADFVFAPDYKLMSLDSVGEFINKNKHLPGIPSAKEVVKNGLDLAVMDATLLQKIEELTLYVLELKKENEIMRKEFLKK